MGLVKLVGAVRDEEVAEQFLKERCILKEYRDRRGRIYMKKFSTF